MAKQYLMPYTNLHELNLDWLINAMKQLEASWEGAEMKVTATASTTSGGATVKVSGNLKDTLNFDFGLPGGNSYPTDTTPKTDSGDGFVGVELTYARGDHVHPSDTSKLDKITYSDETALYAVMNDKQITLPYSGFATATEIENIESDIKSTQAVVANKQDILVSGTNIKTINNYSLLGAGNINTSDTTLLWINVDLTTPFDAQTINLSSSVYKNLLIIYRVTTGIGYYTTQFITYNPNLTNSLLCALTVAATTYSRNAKINSDINVEFSSGYTGGYTEANNVMIPYMILGIE